MSRSKPLLQNAGFQNLFHGRSLGECRHFLSRETDSSYGARCCRCPENKSNYPVIIWCAIAQLFGSKEIRDLREAALLVNKRQHVHGFARQNVKSRLVVLVFNVLPNDVLSSVLLLLKLENMLDKELLKLLVGKVDAQLLKAVETDRRRIFSLKLSSKINPTVANAHLFLVKFSKPKMSRRPIDCWRSLSSSVGL